MILTLHPTLQTTLSLSVCTATTLSQFPSLSVFHKDLCLDLLYSLLFTQLLFPPSLKSALSFTTHTLMTLSSRNMRPLIKSQISSSPCRSVLTDDVKTWMTVTE